MNNYVVFDSHCDTATELWKKHQTVDRTDCQISLPQQQTFAGCGQYFAFCTLAGKQTGYTCEQLLWEPYHYFMKQLETHQDTMMLCTGGADFDKAVEAHKVAAFLSLEGAEGINCDPGRLEELRQAGITMVNLTWNADNALAGSSKDDGPGLTAQGREFVRRAQKLGIVIDVSHLSDRAFWDLMDVTEKPIVASHSNSRSRCGHCRNLTDDMYRALCETGGYAGINLYARFLEDDGAASLESVYVHMDHFLQLGGDGHLALGGDMDGCDELPAGFAGVKDYAKLAAYLENKGFSEDTIQKIYSKTMKKVVTICTM